MNQRAIPWVTTFVFFLTLSCNDSRNNAPCEDASCCEAGSYRFVEYLANEPVALTGPPYSSDYNLRFAKGLPTHSDAHYQVDSATICETSRPQGMPVTFDKRNDPKSFPYRVSGKLMAYTGERLVHKPILIVYVDKIEKAKL